jgi:hypothetical protein
VTSYYNEIDPYAAQWLRNLIAEGLIAKGDVDERSIKDVRGSDLAGYTQCHFFAGIGGWSYALRLAGWPDSEPVWTGSCPCQPLSSAGQRKGHADERHLWPAFHALIAERRPATVFGEQVASKDGREWLAGVRADLEALGYASGPPICALRARAHRTSDNEFSGWPTPNRGDYQAGFSDLPTRGQTSLPRTIAKRFKLKVGARRGTANLRFLSWIMGFPPTWLRARPSAMPSSRKSRRRSSSAP